MKQEEVPAFGRRSTFGGEVELMLLVPPPTMAGQSTKALSSLLVLTLHLFFLAHSSFAEIIFEERFDGNTVALSYCCTDTYMLPLLQDHTEGITCSKDWILALLAYNRLFTAAIHLHGLILRKNEIFLFEIF